MYYVFMYYVFLRVLLLLFHVNLLAPTNLPWVSVEFSAKLGLNSRSALLKLDDFPLFSLFPPVTINQFLIGFEAIDS